MGGEYDMDYSERALLYEEERIDLEFAVVHSIEKGLREKGKTDAADDVKKAAELLRQAVSYIKSARKFSGVSTFEQIQMDFFDK